MTEYVECYLNGQFPLMVPDFRADFWNAREHWERGRMEHMAATLRPGMTVYDCGSEHGDMTSCYKSWVGPSGDVIPIEPAPHYWPFIRGTWEANDFGPPPHAMFCGFVGQQSSAFAAGIHLGAGGWCPHTEGEGVPDGGFKHLKYESRNIPTASIDSLATYAVPDAIVVDVEGAEQLVMEGARTVLETIRPLVWISVHDIADGDWPGPLKGWYGHSLDTLNAFMDEMNYSAEELPWNGEGEHFWYYSPR